MRIFRFDEQSPVYRYLREEQHADNFSHGRDIRISSISTCRKAEGCSGDAHEASLRYIAAIDQGNSSDRDVREILRRGSIAADPGIALENVKIDLTYFYEDAFVLCCTRERSVEGARRFGPFCVRISRPDIFVRLAGTALNYEAVRRGYWLSRYWMAPVTYRERAYEGLRPAPAAMFIKSRQYESEKEVRMVWLRSGGPRDVEPIHVSAPELGALCTRVS